VIHVMAKREGERKRLLLIENENTCRLVDFSRQGGEVSNSHTCMACV